MKRQIYLTALSTVTILVILFSILGRNGTLPGFLGGTENRKESNTIYLAPFTSIDLDVSVAALTLEYNDSNSYSISYEVTSPKLTPIAEITGDTLHITQPKAKNTRSSRNYNAEITLSVPDGITFNDLTLDMGVGGVELNDLTADKLALSAGVGDVEIRSCSIQTAVIESGTGDIRLLSCPIASLDISNGLGAVDICVADDLIHYDLDITVGMGALTVDGTEKGGFGSEYKQTGDGQHSCKISVGTGDVELSGNYTHERN